MSRSDDQFAVIAEVSALLLNRNVEHWLGGGWAVDFRSGRINRERFDSDIVVALNGRGSLTTALGDSVARRRRRCGNTAWRA